MSLRKAREKAGKTQEQAAQEAGLSANGWRKLESGKVENPRSENMRAAAKAVGVPGPQFIDEFRPAMQRLRDRRGESQGESEGPRVSASPPPSAESPMASPPPMASPAETTASDRKFAEDDGIAEFVEAETGNAVGMDPADTDLLANPVLVRIGLRSVLKNIMWHLGPEETIQVFRQAFPRQSLHETDDDKHEGRP